MAEKQKGKPWTSEDETRHQDSTLEWWCLEAFFTTKKDKKNWSYKADFTEWNTYSNEKGSFIKATLFDIGENKIVEQYDRDDKNRLQSSKKGFNIGYKNSLIKGRYPEYDMFFENPENNMEVKIKYIAKSKPHWVTENITNGWLPLGLGFYRYGFIPKGKITGTLKIHNEEYEIEGEGYYEHIWGNFTYQSLLGNLKSLKKSIQTYLKLISTAVRMIKPKIPSSIKMLSENNPLGYDWAWFLADNGWTFFYGNIMFWLMEGPVAGVLIMTKDGEHYEEFYTSSFKYTNLKKAKKYDFYYPTGYEIISENGSEKIVLKCEMTTDIREYLSEFDDEKYWKGLAICEAPGVFKGYHYDGKKKTSLKGACKIEPQRQISAIGHNKIEFHFLTPPKGLGLKIDVNSHFLKKNIYTNFQLFPKMKTGFNIEKICKENEK